MSSDRPILEVDGIGRSFGRNRVLTSASFAAREGRVTALMGRNGSGKSTLLRIAVGSVRADWGRVLYRGRFLPRPRLARLARAGLMYSAQESALTSLFSVLDHLEAFARRYDGHGRMHGVVERMALEEFLERRPGEISGGEKQRVSLALALVRAPYCLLMDEPFAGVAPRDRPLIARGLRELAEGGCALVVTGHDVEDLLEVSDEVLWLTAGTTHWLGSPAEASGHPQFRREYLGPRGLPAVG